MSQTDETNATLKCPVAFTSAEDITTVRTIQSVTVKWMNYIISHIVKNLFVRYDAVVDGKPVRVTLWDIYNPKCSSFKLSYPITVTGVSSNKSMSQYMTREILNIKNPFTGMSTPDIIAGMQADLETILGERVNVPATYLNESLYSKIDPIISNFVVKKQNLVSGNAKKDNTWKRCCKTVAAEARKTNTDIDNLARQLELMGIQNHEIANGLPLVLPKWKDKKVNAPTVDEEFSSLYAKAFEMFMTAVIEKMPTVSRMALLAVPSTKIDWNGRDTSLFYDVQGTLTGLPTVGKRKSIKFVMRTQSGHSGNKYFPSDPAEHMKKSAKIGIRLADVSDPADLCVDPENRRMAKGNSLGHIAVTFPAKKVKLDQQNSPLTDADGIGIDLNEAVFLANTTIKISSTKDVVDFPEAIRAYREAIPDAYQFTRAPARVVREMNDLADYAAEKDRTLSIGLMVGLRDGRAPSESLKWQPAVDPLNDFFKWALSRTADDGSPFYSPAQLSIIAHNRDFRHSVRQETANRLHYHCEQSKWDLTHDNEKDPFINSDTAQKLLAEREEIAVRIDSETSRLFANAIDGTDHAKMKVVAMENVDLGELKTTYRAKSLFMTAKSIWGMADGKLNAKIDADVCTVTFETECGRFDMDAIASTEYWEVTSKQFTDNTITVNAKPTKEYEVTMAQDWIDGYTKRAVHFSSIKNMVAALCSKRGLHFVKVDPAYTSQICHVCHPECKKDKFVKTKKEGKFSMAECRAKRLNFREGRTFICGNPECACHGRIQNADDNAAMNILHKGFFCKNESVIRC